MSVLHFTRSELIASLYSEDETAAQLESRIWKLTDPSEHCGVTNRKAKTNALGVPLAESVQIHEVHWLSPSSCYRDAANASDFQK